MARTFNLKAQKRLNTCSRSVKDASGTGYVFAHELTREIAARTGSDLVSINYIMDTYKDIILEHLDQGRKVELERIGTIVFKMKKSFFCHLVRRTIPDRYFPRFIFKPSLRQRVRDHVTSDMIPPK